MSSEPSRGALANSAKTSGSPLRHEDIERLWFQAMRESIEAGEPYIRHRFAALVAAAEREACAKACEERQVFPWAENKCAAAIRARGSVK